MLLAFVPLSATVLSRWRRLAWRKGKLSNGRAAELLGVDGDPQFGTAARMPTRRKVRKELALFSLSRYSVGFTDGGWFWARNRWVRKGNHVDGR